LEYENQPIHFQNTKMTVNEDKTLTLKSEIKIGDEANATEIDINALLEVSGRTKIQFTNAQYGGDESAQKLGKAIIDHVNNLLDLDKFVLDGTKLRVDRARVKDKQFVFYGTAEISHFPERKK
jgi:hypothetical protein